MPQFLLLYKHKTYNYRTYTRRIVAKIISFGQNIVLNIRDRPSLSGTASEFRAIPECIESFAPTKTDRVGVTGIIVPGNNPIRFRTRADPIYRSCFSQIYAIKYQVLSEPFNTRRPLRAQRVAYVTVPRRRNDYFCRYSGERTMIVDRRTDTGLRRRLRNYSLLLMTQRLERRTHESNLFSTCFIDLASSRPGLADRCRTGRKK